MLARLVRWSRGTFMQVAGLLQHSPRAAVSPARGGIGSKAQRPDGPTWGGHNRGFPSSWDVSGRTASAVDEHDLPNRPAADALDAAEQLHLLCHAAATVVPHLRNDVADQHGAL